MVQQEPNKYTNTVGGIEYTFNKESDIKYLKHSPYSFNQSENIKTIINSSTIPPFVNEEQLHVLKEHSDINSLELSLNNVFNCLGERYLKTKNLIVTTSKNVSKEKIAQHFSTNIIEECDKYNPLFDFFLLKYNSIEKSSEMAMNCKNQLDWVHAIDYDFIKVEPNTPFIFQTDIINDDELNNHSNHKVIKAESITKSPLLQNIKIGILDCGIFKEHDNLTYSLNTCYNGYDFIENLETPYNEQNNIYHEHGTNCAGLIASKKTGNKGFEGLAPGVCLYDYKIGFNEYNTSQLNINNTFKYRIFDIIKALNRSVFKDECDILNCSWNGLAPNESTFLSIETISKFGRKKLGTPIVIAAGNMGIKTPFPGNLENCITVSAVDENYCPIVNDERHTWGSNFGCQVDIAATGEKLVTTSTPLNLGSNTIYGFKKNFFGTSASAPLVTASIAHMMTINSELNLSEIKYILKRSTSNIKSNSSKNYGSGVLHVKKLITNTNQFTNLKNNLQMKDYRIIILTKPLDYRQSIYSSSCYGSFFGITAFFDINLNSDNPKKNTVKGLSLKLNKYKGLINIGFHENSEENKNHNKLSVVEINGNKVLELTCTVKGVLNKNPKLELPLNEITIDDNVLNTEIGEYSYFKVDRKLVSFTGLNNDEIRTMYDNQFNQLRDNHVIVNGVVDNEFFYVNGTQFLPKSVNDNTLKNITSNNLLAGTGSISCHTSEAKWF